MTFSTFCRRAGVALLGALFLTSCASVTALEPGPYTYDKAMTIQVGETWTKYPRVNRTKSQGLTIDGSALNTLSLTAKLKAGAPLIYTLDREKILPVFGSDMLLGEVAEFTLDSLSFIGMQNTTLTELTPDQFGDVEAVRFTFTGDVASGLSYQGMAKAAIHDEQLYLILYYAPAEYYYGLHEQEVQTIMDSATIL